MKLAGLGVGYVFTLVVTRFLGADAFGVLSLCIAVLTLATIVGRCGVDTALLRLVAVSAEANRATEIRRRVRAGLVVVGAASGVVATLTWISADFWARTLVHDPGARSFFRVAALGVPPLSIAFVSFQSLRGLKRITAFVFFEYVARFLFALALLPVVLLVVAGPMAGILAYVGGLWALAIASTIVLFRVSAATNDDPSSEDENRYRKLLSIGLPLLVASSIMFVKGWIDTIMIGMYHDPRAVGIYAVALKLATLTTLPLLAINSIAAPKFAVSHGNQDVGAMAKVCEQSGRLIAATTIPIAAGLLVAPRLWLSLFGSEFAEGAPALVVLAGGYLFSALAGSVGYLLQMAGRQVAFQNITTLIMILNVLTNWLLVPRYGITGAAVSTSVGLIAWNAACLWYVRRALGFWSVEFMWRWTRSPA
jgi:O-antigen/teichoic acid export membrane protein